MRSWASRIVLSLLVAIQAAAVLGLLATFVLAPTRMPLSLVFLVAMTALLVSAGLLVFLVR